MNNTPDSPAKPPDDRTDQGGNYWTLFTPGIWKVLHAVLECGARIHKLRVYETMKELTRREVCAYLLVRGSLHAHAYALALKKITGVAIEQMLPTPNINLAQVPECQKYLDESKHRRLYTFSPEDYAEAASVWSNDEVA